MTEAKHASFVELLRDAQSGDESALSLLLEHLYVRVTQRMLRDSTISAQLAGDTAEDIAAETIEKIADAYPRCEARTDPELLAWTFRIASNIATDRFRSMASRIFLLCVADALEDMDRAPSARLSDEPPLDEDDSVLLQVTMHAYDQLPATAAEILWHRLVEQPSWAETARRYGTTEGGARRRFQRAVSRLRRSVGRGLGERPVREREAAQRALDRRAVAPSGRPHR